MVSAYGNKQEQAMDINHLAIINKVRSRLRIKESTINFYLVKATSGSSTNKTYGNIWRILNNQCNIIWQTPQLQNNRWFAAKVSTRQALEIWDISMVIVYSRQPIRPRHNINLYYCSASLPCGVSRSDIGRFQHRDIILKSINDKPIKTVFTLTGDTNSFVLPFCHSQAKKKKKKITQELYVFNRTKSAILHTNHNTFKQGIKDITTSIWELKVVEPLLS